MKAKGGKVALTLKLDAEAATRLKLNAVASDTTASAIVAGLVMRHLPRLAITRAGGTKGGRP